MIRARFQDWRAFDFGLVTLALATQIYFFVWDPHRPLVGDENYYWSHALAWAQGRSLAEHPFWPPGPIRWLGLWISLLGPHRWALALIQTGLHGLNAWCWNAIGQSFGASKVQARRIGLCVWAYPELVAFCHFLWPETLHWTLFSVALVCLTRKQTRLTLLAGLLLGVCLWFKSYLLPFLPVLFIGLLLTSGKNRVSQGTALLVPILISFFLLNGWMDRNMGPGAHRGSGPFNLWLGLQDPFSREWEEPIAGRLKKTYDGWPGSWSDRADRAQSESYQILQNQFWLSTLGRQLRKQPFRLLSDQTTALNLMPGGIHAKQQPGPLDFIMIIWFRLCHWILLLSFFWGWPALLRQNRFLALVFASFMTLYLGLFVLFHVKTRFFLPFIPMLIFKLGMNGYPAKRKAAGVIGFLGLCLIWVSIQGPIP